MTMLLRQLGDEFTANTTTAGQQLTPKVAALPSGGYVSVWSSEFTFGDPSDIAAQMFSANGTKIGGEIRVNLLGESAQFYPTVAALASGGFVVTWTHYLGDVPGGGDGSGNSVKARVFDASGVPLGPDFLVNTNVSNDQKDATVAALPGGGFVIGWTDSGQPQGGDALRAQRFDASGGKVGQEFAINTAPLAQFVQADLEVVALSGGNFVFAWTHLSRGFPDQIQVRAQMFDSAGNGIGSEFLVAASGGPGSTADLAALPNGGFVASWQGYDSELEISVVRAQMFDSTGAKTGPEVTASNPEDRIGSVTVTTLAGGGFLVGWVNSSSDDNRIGSIRGQMYDAEGNRLSGQFEINSAPVDDLFTHPDLTTLSSGRIVAAWEVDSPNTANDVKMQIFRAPLVGTPLEDWIDGTGEDDGIAGLASDDILYGNGGNDSLEGGSGNDRLDGGSGSDTMAGGAGDDVYFVDADDLIVENADEGTDIVLTATAAYVLAQNVENLIAISDINHDFRGNAVNNAIFGATGNDLFRLYDGGDDSVFGNDGNDNFFFIGSLTSDDVVRGGAGVDTLILQGNYAGGLTLTSAIQEMENISILGGGNTNFGEPGTNRYDYVLTTNDANFATGVQARINGSALLAGEDFNFNGSAETDAKFVVYGGKGVDTLTGGLGADIFFFAEERFASGDTVNGGAGYDGMFLRGNYTVDFNAPGYTGLFTNIENLTLTSATDERYARGGGSEFDYNLILSDVLVGAGQVLTVSGTILTASETMILDGSQETDGLLRLFGGKAGDTLKGGGQADLIHGNLGADILAGNGGADAFRYQAIAESNAATRDQILDFTPGTDKIELDRIDANSLVAGDQAFSWIGSSAFTGMAGQLRAYAQSGTWYVEGDVNGDSVADLVIALTLQGPTPLGAGDFLL